MTETGQVSRDAIFEENCVAEVVERKFAACIAFVDSLGTAVISSLFVHVA